MAKEYDLLPFDLMVLEPRRTLCEKIMSMVRFSYGNNPIEDLKKTIRHSYDIHQLLLNEKLFEFFHTNEFDKLLLKVASDDVASYKNKNKWLINHPLKAKIFAEVDSVWEELKSTYNGDFKKMVFGNFPDDQKILKTLLLIKKRLELVDWTITI